MGGKEGVFHLLFICVFCTFIGIVVYKNTSNTLSVIPMGKNMHLFRPHRRSTSFPRGSRRKENLSLSDTGLSYTCIPNTNRHPSCAGIRIETGDTAHSPLRGISLQQFDYMEITASSNAPTVTISLAAAIPEYSREDTLMRQRIFQKIIGTDTSQTSYSIALHSFFTPPEWYRKNTLPSSMISEKDFSNVLLIHVKNGPHAAIDKLPQKLEIRNLRFVRDLTGYNTCAAITIIVFIFLYLYYFYFRRGREKTVVIPYTQLDISSYQDEDADKVEAYIADNYHNQSLLVKDVSRHTGVPLGNIKSLLKKKFSLSFRQYLNEIRICEAERLLCETDRQVTDIAYRVGYRNVSHFNRLFKEKNGESPNKYRKKQRKIIRWCT
jgi:AraC-like DNA-binding protein